MRSVNDIRQTFLNYFESAGHKVVPSSSLVPENDPTLMFTNAGMVQFKNVFTGAEKRDYSTAVSSQKCVRAGGKHNDLENVGYTARHHTFFEMLGNFSFGDYFKERAIELAWNLITKDYGLAKDRLLVTVYADDEDAFSLWRKIAGLPEDRIIKIATNDNFWRMGDTGPCGPCSEIFFDHGDKIAGGSPGSADEDGDRFIEIWNLVFMQFEEQAGGARVNLPRPSIDTGMGLERISAVLQGKHNNYEIDLFQTLTRTIREKAASLLPSELSGKIEASCANAPQLGYTGEAASLNVIADHLRATSFLIADGVLPSNEGRGYVLRRIMRRAMRHIQMLGFPEPLMWQLVPALVHEMGAAYPQLVQTQPLIAETLKLEETRFRQTLNRGLALLDDAAAHLHHGDKLSGETAFTLYDTYGFPLDLTQDALRQRGISVDVDGFNAAMQLQKTKARAAWAGSGDSADESIWFKLRDEHGSSEFLGYDRVNGEGIITALLKNGAPVDMLNAGDEGQLILNQTVFYGESGGQVGDSGTMQGTQSHIDVSDTQKKLGAIIAHKIKVTKGAVHVGDALSLGVDAQRRTAIRANHSATHILHEALRLVLGEHVAQKGSLVAPERLRFDITQPKPITADEQKEIENIANAMVLENTAVTTRLMNVDDAKASGARALFGEKYGDEVRVVAMGTEQNGKAWSVELCGGTHAARTGDIGLITIISESAVSSGVRRIEALTGEAARRYLNAQSAQLRELAALIKVAPQDIESRLSTLLEERKNFERDNAGLRKKLAMGDSSAQNNSATQIAGVSYLTKIIDGVAANDLKNLVDEGKSQLGSGVVVFIGVNDGKASLVVGVTEDLTTRFSAVDLVRAGAEALGGKGGGGRPDMAQAGGPEASKAENAIKAIAEKMAS